MKWSALVLIVATVACGPGTRQGAGGDDDDDGSGGSGSNVGSGGSGSDGCSDAAKLIYVVDETNKLARFDPTTKTFTTLGTLSCPAGVDSNGDPAAPFSMAVDRTAQAYVLYNDDKIYKVDTTMTSLPCTKTAWSSQHGLSEFGMGYSTDTMGGSTDTLYVAGGADLQEGDGPATSTLATLDTGAFSAAMVGTVNGWPELTGNSNAELWGFFPDVNDDGTTPTVVQINKTSGAAMTTYMEPTLDGIPAAWAFGFYGGDYWVFLAFEDDSDPLNPTAEPTKVYQVAGPSSASGSPGSVVSTTSAGGLIIVGAGVSTCAPIVIE
jgi:hypothetical protein